jgi:UDP-N-acetyl-D-galactosamine dehydrogenase
LRLYAIGTGGAGMREKMLMNKLNQNEAVVCVVGLGYVGLPLAMEFSKSLRVIGYDINNDKINKLNNSELNQENKNPVFTNDPTKIRDADFIIITVPTPVTKSKEPDLSYVEKAAKTISQNLKRGSVVILESTVYPGVTEEVLKPILEESGLRCGEDFKVAYSPERINPGDDAHVLQNITKIVSGMDDETRDIVSKLYERITTVYTAKDIKTAEAAKVIENVQRDLNIALMNELSLMFEKMGLNTKDVLDAAATKWNFHRYSPGLVGGHCIPVDPYYLVYKAKELGYHPQVILAGRAINDYMSKHVVEIAIKALNEVGKVIKGSKVLIMGLTYKENVADIRETPVMGIIKELREFGIEIFGFDPLLKKEEIEAFGIDAVDAEDIKGIFGKVDCVIGCA